MPIEVRPFAGDVRQFMQAVEVPFGWAPHDEDTEVFAPLVELDRALAAYDAGRVVGTAGIFSMRIGVPGGELPMAGVTMVGVHPTHRRRGILREMMRRQLDAVHERGEPLAGLWASESAIYQRFGYGMGTLGARLEVDRSRTAFRQPHAWSGGLRLVDADEAQRAFPQLWEQVWLRRPGAFARSADWWRAEFLYDPEHHRRGGSPLSLLLHETDGRPTGYAAYRLFPEWDERGPKSTLEAFEVIGLTPAAELDLWRYLFDVDLVSTVRARNLPVDGLPFPVVAEPRRLGWGMAEALWLRLVDVGAALEGRRYTGSGRVTFELADPFCAWNAGRWTLEVEDGAARATRSDEEPQLALDVGDLAAAYLGAWRFSALAAAGRVAELHPGGARLADALFASALAPWCPKVF